MGKQPDETIEEDGKEKEIELETEASTKESLTNLDDDTTQEEDSDEINIEEEDGNEKETKLETETSTEESLPNLDNDSEQEVDSAEFNMEEMYEQSLKGELITGEIIKIDEEYVLVDVGYKSEGIIPIREFKDADGNLTAKAGDKVDVVLERKENDEGVVTLSMERAKKIKVWDQIRDIQNSDGTIQGKVVHRVKGGLSIDVGLPAFLPGSQIDLQPIRDLDSLVGKVMDLKILKYNKRRNNIIVSRRALLEEERVKHKAETLSLIKEGSVLNGKVKNITDYGLFVDLGGIDGLLHITDMSWGRVSHPSTMSLGRGS
jgi:small subunit ribosomal protein S1